MLLGILHREVGEHDLFALDVVAQFVQRLHDAFQVRVALLVRHLFLVLVEERTFGDEHLRVENLRVVEERFAHAVAREA